jgi:hypothetical protein
VILISALGRKRKFKLRHYRRVRPLYAQLTPMISLSAGRGAIATILRD